MLLRPGHHSSSYPEQALSGFWLLAWLMAFCIFKSLGSRCVLSCLHCDTVGWVKECRQKAASALQVGWSCDHGFVVACVNCVDVFSWHWLSCLGCSCCGHCRLALLLRAYQGSFLLYPKITSAFLKYSFPHLGEK